MSSINKQRLLLVAWYGALRRDSAAGAWYQNHHDFFFLSSIQVNFYVDLTIFKDAMQMRIHRMLELFFLLQIYAMTTHGITIGEKGYTHSLIENYMLFNRPNLLL